MESSEAISELDKLIAVADEIERAAAAIQIWTPPSVGVDKSSIESVQNSYQWWNQLGYQLMPPHLQKLFFTPYDGVTKQGMFDSTYVVSIRNFIANPTQVTNVSIPILTANQPRRDPRYVWTHPYTENFEQLFRMQVNTLKEAREFYRSHKPMMASGSTEGIVALSESSLARSHTVFVGHGHSDLYLRVVRFIERGLGLHVLFFEDEVRAGLHNLAVLQDFLDRAGFAVIVATGDDTDHSGQPQARLNVIHEVGLFQGKLGFNKVALMRQCNVPEFSNLAGYQDLRFEGNDINGRFEDLRNMLRREGMSSDSSNVE